jgi:hypothetical protein
MEELHNWEDQAYHNFLAKKDELLGEYPGQYYPFKLENLFANACQKIAQGLVYEKYTGDQAATLLKGTYKAYEELKNDLN